MPAAGDRETKDHPGEAAASSGVEGAASPGSGAVVALAGSAGGLGALEAICSALPADFPAPVLVLLHLDPHHPSLLAQLLARKARLRVVEAAEGLEVLPGTVYVAVPDQHLELDAVGRIHLSHGPRIHFSRPAADRLFTTVAACCGSGAVAVLCTGTGQDGSDGMAAVRRAGGHTLAQSPETCAYAAMPKEAIRRGVVDEVIPLSGIAERLVELVEAGHSGRRSSGDSAPK